MGLTDDQRAFLMKLVGLHLAEVKDAKKMPTDDFIQFAGEMKYEQFLEMLLKDLDSPDDYWETEREEE